MRRGALPTKIARRVDAGDANELQPALRIMSLLKLVRSQLVELPHGVAAVAQRGCTSRGSLSGPPSPPISVVSSPRHGSVISAISARH